jgi:hypothetical protein
MSALVCAFLVLMLGGRAVAAEERVEHVFDPALSLRGSCAASGEDPIPDPGPCPGIAGTDHPLKSFTNPCGTTVDAYGNIYVASEVPKSEAEGKVDVFNAAGEYLVGIEGLNHPCDVAVDSEGNLYVLENASEHRVVLFTPSSYPPQASTQYPSREEAVVVTGETSLCDEASAIAIDPSNDHLYIRRSCVKILEFDSAAANLPGGEWAPIGEVGETSGIARNGSFNVYGKNHFIYGAGYANGPGVDGTLPASQRVYVLNGATGEPECQNDGHETPNGGFSFSFGRAAVAVDQSNGDFYVSDEIVNKAIYRFNSDCEYVDELPSSPPEYENPDLRPGLAADAPCIGEGGAPCDLGGYHSPNDGYVFVGSGQSALKSHLFAFKPKLSAPPEIEGQEATAITADEAVVRAQLNPGDLDTHYHFEYISQADYEADLGTYGAGAISVPVPDGEVKESASFVEVYTAVAGLEPGTSYRFRLVAENEEGITKGENAPGAEGEDATFTTLPLEASGLPDGRGYELVTPPDTGGYVPTMNELGFTPYPEFGPFPTDFVASDGESVLFGIEGGSIPGLSGSGFHDTYEARREPDGRWHSEFSGVAGTEARHPTPNGFSADHGSSFWALEETSNEVDGEYIHRLGGALDPACALGPESDLELIGCGSLGVDARVHGGWISPHAEHVIFSTGETKNVVAERLEPEAPGAGTAAVYDRTPDGVTHVVSLKPGDVPFEDGEDASFEGASADGTAVAFKVEGTLYVRLDNAETSEVAAGSPLFGGFSSHGDRIVYLEPNAAEPLLPGTEKAGQIPQGDLFLCEVRQGPCVGPQQSQEPIAIGAGDKSVLVNVSADGSHVYFVSPAVLDGAEEGVLGASNLYVWDRASEAIGLVATVSTADVVGRPGLVTEQAVGGLGLWIPSAVNPDHQPTLGPGADPSRSTPDGSAFVFESRADLTDYESNEHSEIYRYDSGGGGELGCLSCNPTGRAASQDAQLQSDTPHQFISLPPVNALASIANVTSDGRRVFFQSSEQLVLSDVDGKTDVYVWEEQGEGGCVVQGGCVHLISSGQSATDDYLYAMTPDGSDVFFETGDLLVAEDKDSTPSVYDARIGGGAPAPEQQASECLGEACQPSVPAPVPITPGSASFEGPRNRSGRQCPKGRHLVRRHGKKRCVKPHRHRRHSRRKRGAGR